MHPEEAGRAGDENGHGANLAAKVVSCPEPGRGNGLHL
jgi:hypothetical protein